MLHFTCQVVGRWVFRSLLGASCSAWALVHVALQLQLRRFIWGCPTSDLSFHIGFAFGFLASFQVVSSFCGFCCFECIFHWPELVHVIHRTLVFLPGQPAVWFRQPFLPICQGLKPSGCWYLASFCYLTNATSS